MCSTNSSISLGASKELHFEDVWALDEPDLLPRPTLALILIFPDTPAHQARQAALESTRAEYTGSGAGEPVVWFKQTIGNACGLYAILHALSNGFPRRSIEPESILSRLLDKCIPQDPANRARVLEGSAELEQAHAAVAKKGDSAVPERAENEVDYHYICFARSEVNGCLYQLDGNRKGSVVVGEISIGDDGDILNEAVISHVKAYIGQGGGNIGFGCMALVHRAT